MDLGLTGRKAIVCASSRGLGRACARALAEDGVDVAINGRDAAVVESTAMAIAAETGVEATPVVADLDTEDGRARLLEACSEPDILVNNNGGPPPRQQSVDTVRGSMLANILAGRFGDREELGRACAFLCSAHSGFITGQNLLLDGGYFPGAF